ncbi:hypothetical protein BGZ96_008871 [Linnemannia gamsii]|uniref:Uncharacterized protein n=1 Tax=Linnemannia gamsii TaxID=64522 RepID=A0ABQ7JYF8_9FUNG|nr:hypothetical protein BGZ96_008871 [Linnemannia gamsii]
MVVMALGLEATDMASGSGPITLSLFDYHSHIRHLDLEAIAITEYNSIAILHPPEMLDFIHKDDFMDKCRRIHVPSAVLANMDVLEKIFPKEVVWSLAYPILEQLESLVISVGDIGRYAAVVGRLRRLRRVRFYMDEVFDYNGLEDEYDPDDIRGSGEEDRNVIMLTLVQFVVEHTRLFKGCLNVVQFSSSGEDNTFFEEASVPWETQLAILRVLPAPYKPKWLRNDNWMQFATKPLATNLLQVGYINSLALVDL